MKRILKEPLLHFLLIGAALFAAYGLINRERQERPDEIVVTAGRVENLAEAFSRFQQRPPTADELKGLIDQYVREEIFSREAMKLGLDQDDSVIRRRLQQKMEFVATDMAAVMEPTETELAAWLGEHPDRFRLDPRMTFRSVYLNPDKHGDHLEADVAVLLTQLQQQDRPVEVATLGDASLSPQEMTDAPQTAIASQFGPEFAEKLAAMDVGQWTGPVRSGLGVHLVLVTARSEGRVPELKEVRDEVLREVANARRIEANRAFLEALLDRYKVTIEWPEASAVGSGKVASAR